MVYIHVKKVGDKRYYTLRMSIRDKQGNIITKDLENLGSDVTKIKLENLEKKYYKEIRKSYRTINRFLKSGYYLEKAKLKKLKKDYFLNKEQLEKIEATQIHFNSIFLKLDKKTKQEIYELFLIKFAVSSTSIEGNTITLNQAYKLLQQNITPKNKDLREVYDLQNTKKVFFELLNKKPKITFKLIEEIHDKLLKNIDVRKGYRSQDIKIFGQPFNPSEARYVKQDMKLLIKWYQENKNKLHPLVLATLFHHKFENIHPFSDGNGRTGRIIMNHILILNKFPPIVISKTTRIEYIDVLSEADKAIKNNLLSTNDKNYSNLLNFMFAQYIDTYWNTFLV